VVLKIDKKNLKVFLKN